MAGVPRPRQVQLLDYAPRERAIQQRATLVELGICTGVIVITITMTFGAAEGRDGYVEYLYPMAQPLLNRVFGHRGIPDSVLFVVCLLYWPAVGFAAHFVSKFVTTRRRGGDDEIESRLDERDAKS